MGNDCKFCLDMGDLITVGDVRNHLWKNGGPRETCSDRELPAQAGEQHKERQVRFAEATYQEKKQRGIFSCKPEW